MHLLSGLVLPLWKGNLALDRNNPYWPRPRTQLVAGLWLDQGADLELAVDVWTRLDNRCLTDWERYHHKKNPGIDEDTLELYSSTMWGPQDS